MESGRTGRWSILVPELPEVWFCRENTAERRVFGANGAVTKETVSGAPTEILEKLLTEHGVARRADAPDFQGGVIALLNYDLARCFEKLPSRAKDDLHAPLAVYAPVFGALVYDNLDKEIHAVVPAMPGDEAAAEAKCRALLDRWFVALEASAAVVIEPSSSPAPVTTFDEPGFCTAVNRIRDYIRAGDTYQVNLSTRQSFPMHASPESVYETLRGVNPSPYMGLFRFPDFTLVCGSPELLVRVRDGKIESRPIAGTRPRGDTPERDAELRAELAANTKENAEHLMLVDLLRNDLGRVSKPGTVHVPEYMTVEKYSHVMHLVSHVVGEPLPEANASDIISSVFPGGTITGAPKVRTMEIIEELEPVRRAFYTGSAGWISGADAMELNIIIRTLHAQAGFAHIQAGAGIVADSVPEREYRESLSKARAMILALAKTPKG
jgi:para-aminobenzoate synthetase component 1